MAEKIEAELLKPLNGCEIGSRAFYSEADFKRLEARGAVKKAPAPRNKKKLAPRNKSKGEV